MRWRASQHVMLVGDLAILDFEISSVGKKAMRMDQTPQATIGAAFGGRRPRLHVGASQAALAPNKDKESMSDQSDVVDIRLIGELAVFRRGKLIALPQSKKTRCLLAYLAVVERPQRRERLCELFWEVPDDPRGALRWSLSKIRQVVGDALEASRESVELNAAKIRLDYKEIIGALSGDLTPHSTDELERLAALFRGPFLADLALPRCSEFDAWRTSHANDVDLLQIRLRRALIDRLRSDPSRAIVHANALVALNPEDKALGLEVEALSRESRRRALSPVVENIATSPDDPVDFAASSSPQEIPADTVTSAKDNLAPALALPDKPSIAVMPFQNISGDSEQEYFADGLTEDIITGLSRQRWFFVIARNSSFAFKGEATDIRRVASELGVRYVLEGSVRKASDRVRVTAQLVDASTGVHMWAERYDRELANIFELQDEITNRVIDSVGTQIIVAEAARVRRKPPQNIEAWDLVMQALPHMWRMNMQEQRLAQDLLRRAISLDPEYAHAHALLGWTYVSMFNLDSSTPISEFTNKVLDSGEKAVALDGQDHWGHLVLGLGHARRRRPEPAVLHLFKCLDLNPNFALGHAGLGYAFACGGQPERGLESLQQALRLSPRDPFLALYAPVVRYMALFALGHYEEAIMVCRSTAAQYPSHAGAWRLMTVSLGLLGKIDEARDFSRIR